MINIVAAVQFQLLVKRFSRNFSLRRICAALVFLVFGVQAFAVDCLRCNFDNQNLAFKNFAHSNLSGSSFRNAYLMGTDFTGVVLDGTDFSDAIANLAIFKDAHLKDTVFIATELELSNFEGAHFLGANFTKAYLVHSRLNANNANGAIFCATILFNATVNNRDC